MTTFAHTSPPIERSPMRPRPWFGLLRGLLFAALPGLHFPHSEALPDWLSAAKRRRRVLLALVVACAGGAWALTPADTPTAQLVLQTLLFAWVSAGFATALMGGWVMLRGDRHALRGADDRSPIDRGARTALIMPICNEDIATVFGGLRATCESLAATGALSLFDIYILSDTADPALREAEVKAWERMRQMLGDDPVLAGGRVFYRCRRRRTQRKAGNVADFCRRWGKLYRYMVVLDADSTMHGDTLVQLVRLMEANPKAGIVQTLPAGGGHDTLHARLQQFGARVTGRLFALGMSFWQLGESHYWGHNAILRVAPFMEHCALARLPGRGGLSGDILSHDFVEAALMRRAGYEVWLAPSLDGSWEQVPPNLLDELQRDRRWCQGNLQNARLIAEPGWQPVHRVMFATGALSYAVAPIWLAFVVLGALEGGPAGVNHGGALWALTAALLLLPRLLGVVAVQWSGAQRGFGGSVRLWAGAALELVMSALQAPLRMLAHTSFVLGALTGLKLDWRSPSRDAGAVRWSDALSRVGLLALPVLAAAVLATRSDELTAWHLAPLLVPLILAVPLTVLTGHVGFGRWLRQAGWLTVPEEQAPPRALQRAADNRAFQHLQPQLPVVSAPRLGPAVLAQRALAPFGRPRMALGFGAVALCLLAVIPRAGQTPAFDPAELAQRQLLLAFEEAPQATPVASRRTQVSSNLRKRVRYYAPTKPASRIDDEVRQRASEAVARALAMAES